MVEVQITQKCNNRCHYCVVRRKSDTKAKVMSPAEFIQVCRRLANEIQAGRFTFTGGEPTIHPEFATLLELAQNHLPGWKIHIQSNARALQSAQLSTLLVLAGIYSISISIQSIVPSVHEKLDGIKGGFSEAIQGLKNILDTYYRFGSPFVSVHITLSKLNRHTFLTTMKHLYEMGVPAISANSLRASYGEKWLAKYTLTDSEAAKLYLEAYEYADRVSKNFVCLHSFNFCQFDPRPVGLKHYACAIGKNLLGIDADGIYRICPGLVEPEHALFGSIFDDKPIAEMWNSPELEQYRNHHKTFTTCRQCAFIEACGGVCLAMRNQIKETDLKPFHGIS